MNQTFQSEVELKKFGNARNVMMILCWKCAAVQWWLFSWKSNRNKKGVGV